VIAKNMQDEAGNKIDSAPHPQQMIKIEMNEEVEPYFILRKKVD